jgi:hypothetical protein
VDTAALESVQTVTAVVQGMNTPEPRDPMKHAVSPVLKKVGSSDQEGDAPSGWQ